MNFRSSKLSSVICLALFLVMGLGLSAAPFSRWSEYRSPNGAAVRILGVGDEFSAYFEAEDGHSVVYDASIQAYVYATKDETGGLVSTGVCVGDETAADRILLAIIPLHLRDTSEAEQQRRDCLIEEYERRSGINQRWRALKDEFERRRILKSSGRRLMAASPLKREVVGLTLLVDFPMTNAQGKVTNYLSQVTHPEVNVTNISQMVNGKDCPLWGNASSVREYFEDVSCGKLSYTNIVIGWIKLPHPREYYDGGTNNNGRQGRLLIGDAFDGFKEMPEYKSKYEPLLQRLTYSNENFRALNVFYAGECPPNSRWNLGLWPHQNDLSTNEYNKIIVEVDGKGRHFYSYQISPVTKSPSIGTFCHENGHMVCDFPDLYYYDERGEGAKVCGNGVGNFCLMCDVNEKSPQYICAYLRCVAGWVDPKTMPTNPCRLTVSKRLNDVWKYENEENPREFYLVENRQQSGRDACMPGGGILIWRCNLDGTNASSHRLEFPENGFRRSNEASLEQADGLYQLERGSNSGDRNDSWYKGNQTSGGVFSDDTMPCANWADGTRSGLIMARFSAKGEEMSFEFGQVPDKVYYVQYSLGGGTSSNELPETVRYGNVFSLSTPERAGYEFCGWSVSGCSSDTAKWGVSENPSNPIASAAVRCVNTAGGPVYFRNLVSKDESTVKMFAQWRPLSEPSVSGDYYVSALWGSDANDGHSWDTAFASIQKAVGLAPEGEMRVAVYDGYYEPFAVSPEYEERLEILSVNGADRTFIDGSLQWGRGLTNRCASLNGRHQTVNGFTLENGRAENGGGAYQGTFSNCVFLANVADKFGGGSYTCAVYRCRFRDNRAGYGGGSAYGMAYDCRYQCNSATNSGGGAYSDALHNCLIYENDAPEGGGCCLSEIYNCTLTRNLATSSGGGCDCGQLWNSIVWANESPQDPNSANTSNCLYSCVAPLQTGTGNLSSSPQFVDADNGNFHLSSGSPCVDVGSNSYSDTKRDLDDNPRIVGKAVDLGAYESGVSTDNTPLPVPYHWIENYPNALRGSGSDYRKAAADWQCANGHKLWECYAVGLDPDLEDSQLKALIEVNGDVVIISCDPKRPEHTPSSWYRVEGKETLDAAWEFPQDPSHRFFRVVVGPSK